MSKVVSQTTMINKNERIQESKISRRMVYLTNKRLMMVLLLMLIFIPMFSTYFWTDITHSYETDLDFLVIYFREDKAQAETFVNVELKEAYKEYKLKLLTVSLSSIVEMELESSDNLRYEEIRKFEGPISYSEDNYQGTGIMVVSVRRLVQY